MRRLGFFFLLLPLLATVAPGARAEGEPVARVSITPGAVVWSPHVSGWRWSLTVSGHGIYLKDVFEGGARPVLALVAPDGLPLSDGVYSWELRAVPSIETENEEPPAEGEVRDTGPRLFERRTEWRPVVTSGAVRVKAGSFVEPPLDSDEDNTQAEGTDS